MQFCQPCQHLQLVTSLLRYLHNHRRDSPNPCTHAPFQPSCFQKSPGFNPLAISTKSKFIYFHFISSQQPSPGSQGNPAQSVSINVSIIRALPSSTQRLNVSVLELLEIFSDLKCKQELSLEWHWRYSKKCHEVKSILNSCNLMPLNVCHLV